MNIKLKARDTEFSIRNVRLSDADELTRIANNKAIWLNLTDIFPHPYTKESALSWINDNLSAEEKTHFAICIDDVIIGAIGFSQQRNNKRKTVEIGYWLSQDYWGKGIATAALIAITRYVFNNFDIERIQAFVYDYNPASGRVLEKAGYTYEGTLRNNTVKDGKITSEKVYSILKEEFEEKYNEYKI